MGVAGPPRGQQIAVSHREAGFEVLRMVPFERVRPDGELIT
jgi:hypothetical protein